MTGQHPAVAHLLAAHGQAVALAEEANRPDVLMYPTHPVEFILAANDLSTVAIRAGERFIEANMPDTVLRRVAAERDVLAEHTESNGDCSTCVDGKWGYPVYPNSSPQRWPCRTVLALAAGWGWAE